jgi:hypothetical protein
MTIFSPDVSLLYPFFLTVVFCGTDDAPAGPEEYVDVGERFWHSGLLHSV